MRKALVERKTYETDIKVELDLDGTGRCDIDTGIGLLDHMLTLFTFFGGFELKLRGSGDLMVDDHHLAEDAALTLGQAFRRALGDKRGIKRYAGLYLPMDESLCRVILDISGRPYLVYDITFSGDRLGGMSTQNFKEFFKAFAQEAGITLHIQVLYGENDHHKIEAVFKALGRALKEAVTVVSDVIPSSKGVI